MTAPTSELALQPCLHSMGSGAAGKPWSASAPLLRSCSSRVSCPLLLTHADSVQYTTPSSCKRPLRAVKSIGQSTWLPLLMSIPHLPAGLCQFMTEKPRLSLIETSRDASRVRLRPDAVARIQRKRSILDYLYMPLGSLRLVSNPLFIRQTLQPAHCGGSPAC